jgi:transposase
MAWLRVRLTEEEQRIVSEDRTSHPNARIREKMLVLWLLHNGVTRQKAAEIVEVGRATVQRYVAAYRDGGLDGLRRWDPNRPESEMAAYRESIRESFEEQPVRTVAEACERIFRLTGLRRGPSQVRKFGSFSKAADSSVYGPDSLPGKAVADASTRGLFSSVFGPRTGSMSTTKTVRTCPPPLRKSLRWALSQNRRSPVALRGQFPSGRVQSWS